MMAGEAGIVPPHFWAVSLWEIETVIAGRMRMAAQAERRAPQSDLDMRAALLEAAHE